MMYLIRKSPLTLLGFSMVGAIFAVSLLAPYLATHDPIAINFAEKFQPPNPKHYFGTDDLGMDIYSRVLYAGLYDLSVGFIVLLVATSTGSIVGVISGYFGGKVDEVLMRIADVFMAVPGLILAMAFSAAMQSRSLQVLVFAIALNRWPTSARLVRGLALSLRESQFVEAARAIGAGNLRILFQHMLPNMLSPVIVEGTLDTGRIILTAATLSFVGLGAPPGTPEWGRMVTEGRTYIQYAPWIIVWPGIMIFIAVLGFNLLGDGLRDILDPRGRTRTFVTA